jgi:predicted dehydrogenase
MKSKLIEIKAIYSRSKESAEKIQKCLSIGLLFYKKNADDDADIQIYYGDENAMKEMLKREDIDAVDIALPITMMPSIIQLCFSKISKFCNNKWQRFWKTRILRETHIS